MPLKVCLLNFILNYVIQQKTPLYTLSIIYILLHKNMKIAPFHIHFFMQIEKESSFLRMKKKVGMIIFGQHLAILAIVLALRFRLTLKCIGCLFKEISIKTVKVPKWKSNKILKTTKVNWVPWTQWMHEICLFFKV